MSYPHTHLYCTFHWLAPGDEEGQVGLRFDALDLPTDTQMTDLGARWGTFFSAAGTAIASNLSAYRVKAALIDPTGHYPPGMVPKVKDITPASGGASVGRFPLSISCVSTLVGSAERSPAGRGRIYLPAINAALLTDGMWDGAAATARAGVTATLITDLNEILNASAGIFSSKGAGALQYIEAVRVGNRPDVQRRRTRQTPDVYSADSPVTTVP